MKWKNQIKIVTDKLRKMIYIMKQLREIIKYKDIRTIYLTLFKSLITYGIIDYSRVYDDALS
jgi:hypothetical protein